MTEGNRVKDSPYNVSTARDALISASFFHIICIGHTRNNACVPSTGSAATVKLFPRLSACKWYWVSHRYISKHLEGKNSKYYATWPNEFSLDFSSTVQTAPVTRHHWQFSFVIPPSGVGGSERWSVHWKMICTLIWENTLLTKDNTTFIHIDCFTISSWTFYRHASQWCVWGGWIIGHLNGTVNGTQQRKYQIKN